MEPDAVGFAERKTMLLVFNPRSGVQSFAGSLFDVVDRFSGAGFLVTVYPTQTSGETGRLIAERAADYDCLVCSGGDGTIGEAIDALMSLEKRPTFGVIPSGTINDFASSLGIPRNILAAADVIVNGVASPLDIGRFGERHFSYVAAFGMLTEVPYATPQNAKNLLGKLAYFLEVLKRAGPLTSVACEFDLDGERIAGDFILGVVSNAHSIASIRLPAEMDVRLDDGLFEVILIRKPRTLRERQELTSSLMALAQEPKTDLLTIRKARRVSFASPESVAWTLDGDFGGRFSTMEIENLHHALKVIGR